MTTLLVLIILIFGAPYIWRLIRPYFYRWMQRRTEDYIRKAMGMPPHGGQKKDTGRSGKSSRQSSSYGRSYRRGKGVYAESVIPKEYAEDVEFTEIKTFSDQQTIADDGEIIYRSESQVSDAEIIEIRKDN